MEEKYEWKERRNNLISRQYIKGFLANRGIFVEQVGYSAAKLLNTWLMSQINSVLETSARYMLPDKDRDIRMLGKHIEVGISRLSGESKEGNLIRSYNILLERTKKLKSDLQMCNSRLNSAHRLLRNKGERIEAPITTVKKMEEEYVSKEDLEKEAAEELGEITKRMKSS